MRKKSRTVFDFLFQNRMIEGMEACRIATLFAQSDDSVDFARKRGPRCIKNIHDVRRNSILSNGHHVFHNRSRSSALSFSLCKLLVFRIILERIIPPTQTEAMSVTALLIIGVMRRTQIFDIHFHSNQNTILTFLTKIIGTFYRIGRWWRFPVVTRTFFTSRTNRVWNHCCWWRNILSIKRVPRNRRTSKRL